MKKGQLGFLAGTHVVNDLYQGAIPAMLPFLMAERHYSYAAVSGLAFAASGLSSLFQPLFGVLSDRKPRTWLVPAGFVTAALGVVAAGLSSSYLLTWLYLALAGIGIAAYHPPATSQARAAGGSSQKAMSVFSVGGTIGGSVAPALVTLVIGSVGFDGSYLLAVPALVMAALWMLKGPWMRWRGYVEARPPVIGGRGSAEGGAGRTDDWRSFTRLVFVIIGWSIPFVAVTSMVSLFAQGDLGQSPAAGAAVLTAYTAAGAAGTLLGGWIGDRYGRMAAVRVGYLAALPALLGIAWAPTFWVLVVSAVLFGTAMFLPFAAQVTLAQDYLPTRIGTASGLTLGLAMAAGGLCSPLFGWLADASGLRTTFFSLVLVFIVPVVMALRLPDRAVELSNTQSPEQVAKR
ncbi:MFS transporter, FSR family, fosmidomycin resistance protein [Sinosporangium album]|uniref:MFS transporter, FSR family, fosmidomycin resistance protein n=1 Tax=Sinosporangium album TaxID=504805 RepID=A0A1G7RBK8_9ACTN|nr:MFS transporter [Sinosporangium album]SDG08103.1 MFS transporter, FSR family, fosmidomycin resistance protein [Sinosporangium album]